MRVLIALILLALQIPVAEFKPVDRINQPATITIKVDSTAKIELDDEELAWAEFVTILRRVPGSIKMSSAKFDDKERVTHLKLKSR